MSQTGFDNRKTRIENSFADIGEFIADYIEKDIDPTSRTGISCYRCAMEVDVENIILHVDRHISSDRWMA
jgi:hypothetical protein